MCSNSFAKDYQSEELKKVEGLLSSCNDSIRKFLQSHFNQRSVTTKIINAELENMHVHEA